MRLAGEILNDGSDTSAFIGDAITNAVANPNPMLNQLEINMSRQASDPDITRQLKEKQLLELKSAQLPFS